MRLIVLLPLGSCYFMPDLHAFAPHPTVLTVKYGDQMLPVAKVVGTDPVVMVGDKEKRIRTVPTYLLQPATGFGDGYVHLISASLAGTQLKVVVDALTDVSDSSLGRRFGTSYFDATLKSKTTLKGGFAAVVIYSFQNLFHKSSPYNQSEVIVHDLPELPAGQEVQVKFSAAIPDGQPSQTYFIQIFDGTGREVMTSNMNPAWQFYTRRNLVQLEDAVSKYLVQFKGADHAAVPVMMPKPVFEDGAPTPTTAVSVILTVSAAGTVTEVVISGVEDASLRRAIGDALGGWLFLPQLKSGVAVATKVKVPLQF